MTKPARYVMRVGGFREKLLKGSEVEIWVKQQNDVCIVGNEDNFDYVHYMDLEKIVEVSDESSSA